MPTSVTPDLSNPLRPCERDVSNISTTYISFTKFGLIQEYGNDNRSSLSLVVLLVVVKGHDADPL